MPAAGVNTGVGSAQAPAPMLSRAVAMIIGVILFILFCIVIFSLIMKKAASDTRVSDSLVNSALTSRRETINNASIGGVNSLYGSMNQSNSPVYMTADEQRLVNLCPLTASVGGYLGPLQDGVFDAPAYLDKAFNAGIRSFVLPISVYYDDNKTSTNWPLSGTPAIVYRNINGTILSLNGMNLKTFCEALVQKKSVNAAQAEEPIILYLHGVTGNIPDLANDEENYVKFTSKIAEGLSPLETFRLRTVQGVGSVVGGAAQNKLLTQVMLTDLKNTILVFTNFNINAGMKLAYAKINPKLSEYVNFVYTPLTSTETSTMLCRSIHISDVKATFTDTYRTSWLMTLEDHLGTIQTPKNVDNAINITVQCIPMPFLSGYAALGTDKKKAALKDLSDLTAVYKQWGGYAFRLRQGSSNPVAEGFSTDVEQAPKVNARFSSPPPIVPMKPSATLNARVPQPAGEPPLAPGMISVT